MIQSARPLLVKVSVFVAGFLPLALVFGAQISNAAIPERRNQAPLPVERPDSVFALALQDYDDGRFVEARWAFESLTNNLPRSSPLRPASQLMWARSLYRLGDYRAAESAVLPLAQETGSGAPNPAFAAHGQYLLGLVWWRTGRYADAIRNLHAVSGSPVVSETTKRDARLLSLASVARVEQVNFAEFDTSQAAFVRDALQLNRAIALFNASQMTAARLVLEQLQRISQDTPFASEVAALLADVKSYERTEIRLAVVTPLSGEDSTSGAALLDGVRFAFERLAPPGLSPLVTKSAATQVETIHAVEGFARDTTVLAVIGPLTTENSIVAGAVANAMGLPLVTPTASGEGVCGIGDNIFQINLTARAQGAFLASVVADSLRAQAVAILSTYDPHDQALSSEFARVVREKGLIVIAHEYFITGTTDLTRPLSAIRRAALQRTPPPADMDTVHFMPEINSIDAMLVCSSHETDLVAVAAQIPTQKIWTRVVGNATWGNSSVRQQAGEAAEGVLFATTFDQSYPEARNFAEAYRAERGNEPILATALGYDATSLVLQAISTGARTRPEVRRFLADVKEWPGVTGLITLAPDGCNRNAMVRMIRGGTIRPVGDWQILSRAATQNATPRVGQ